MKHLVSLTIILILISCSRKLQVEKGKNSIIDLINREHREKEGIKKKSGFSGYDQRIFEVRQKAVELYKIQIDLSRIDDFIIIDWINFEGSDFNGEIIINDSLRYFYRANFKKGDPVIKFAYPVASEITLIEYLRKRDFAQLELFAKEKSKKISGSNYIYIGMYNKKTDSIYVKVLPGFISK